MKDRLLIATIWLLVGIVVMQWRMPPSEATATEAGVVALSQDVQSGESYVLDSNGQVWVNLGQPRCWERVHGMDPPVPANQIKHWELRGFVTTDNHAWVFTASGPYGSGQFEDCGAWPGAPVGTAQSSWGKVKGMFGGKGDKK